MSLGGRVPKKLQKKGQRRGLEMGSSPLFYYFTVQLGLLCVGGGEGGEGGKGVGWSKVSFVTFLFFCLLS